MVAKIITSQPELSFSTLVDGMVAAAIAGARALLEAPAILLETKSDGSPVTPADLASDHAIRSVLQQHFPALPVISEECNQHPACDVTRDAFFLVDPLDGTKEFMEARQDFAICVALIMARRPVIGVIIAPALRRVWQGIVSAGEAHAEVFDLDARLGIITASRRGLRLQDAAHKPRSVITSRSHADSRSTCLLACFPEAHHMTMGAALKFTSVASGEACLYPRGTGSMEWDTAAGEAIVLAAGGCIMSETGSPIVYGKKSENFRNGPFIAGRSESLVKNALSQWAAC